MPIVFEPLVAAQEFQEYVDWEIRNHWFRQLLAGTASCSRATPKVGPLMWARGSGIADLRVSYLTAA